MAGMTGSYINAGNHTFGTIVHEMLHSLASDAADADGPPLIEGMTEYFTCLALGIHRRYDRTGGHEMYADWVDTIREGLAAGAYTQADLVQAYFVDGAAVLGQISRDFYRRRRHASSGLLAEATGTKIWRS